MPGKKPPARKENIFNHNHKHGEGCGHTAIEHSGHVDYVHDGHLRHKDKNGWHECVIKDDIEHPSGCGDDTASGCWAHAADEICGPYCGHEAVPHDGHVDYMVPNGKGEKELHCPHNDHCDHHGSVKQHVPPPPAPYS